MPAKAGIHHLPPLHAVQSGDGLPRLLG